MLCRKRALWLGAVFNYLHVCVSCAAAIGVLGCVVLMFFIDPLYAAITIG